jgi:hypothetical protein
MVLPTAPACRYSKIVPLSFRFVPCVDVADGRASEVVQIELARGGLTGLAAVSVIHCPNA